MHIYMYIKRMIHARGGTSGGGGIYVYISAMFHGKMVVDTRPGRRVFQ